MQVYSTTHEVTLKHFAIQLCMKNNEIINQNMLMMFHTQQLKPSCHSPNIRLIGN